MFVILKDLYYVLLVTSIIILFSRWNRIDKRLHVFAWILISALLTEKAVDFCEPKTLIVIKTFIIEFVNGILCFITGKKDKYFVNYSSFDSFRKLVYHAYSTAEIILLGFYYNSLFEYKKNKQTVKTGVLVYLILFFFVYIYDIESLFSFKRIDLLLEGIFISVLSVLFIIELYEKDKPVLLKKYSHFWLVFGNLIFFSSGIFVNIYTQYLLSRSSPVYLQIIYLGAGLNYILYAFYIIAFLCPMETKK